MKAKIKNKKQAKKTASTSSKKKAIKKKKPLSPAKKAKKAKKTKIVGPAKKRSVKKVIRKTAVKNKKTIRKATKPNAVGANVAAAAKPNFDEMVDKLPLTEILAPSEETLEMIEPLCEEAVDGESPDPKVPGGKLNVYFDVSPTEAESIRIDVGRRVRSKYLLNLLCSKSSPSVFRPTAASQPDLGASVPMAAKFKPLGPPAAPPLRPAVKPSKKAGIDFIARDKSSRRLMPSLLKIISSYLRPKEDIQYLDESIEDVFAQPEYFVMLGLRIPRNWYYRTAVFAVIAVVMVLPLQAYTYYQDLLDTKERILLATDQAIDNLKAGGLAATALDFNKATADFDRAKLNFISAEKEISELNSLTTEILKIIPGQDTKIESATSLLEAGEIIAETGRVLVDGGSDFLTGGGDFGNYFTALLNFRSSLEIAINKFGQAKEKILRVNEADLPEEHLETFRKIKKLLPDIEHGLRQVYAINNGLIKGLGGQNWQRYLLIFVNNNELRAGGGFMGSFALLDIDRGQIKQMIVPGGGTYDIQGQLAPKVISPEPLHLINSRWEFQDANWWPDYPTTAKKIQWFYTNAGGPTVDGVITITSTMMERLLDVVGPIPMPEYGREITSQNFVEETQKIVELEYDREENRPKKFLGDLAPKVMENVFASRGEDMQKLFDIFKAGLNEGHIMVYFNDPALEKIIADFGWSGSLRQASGDYLAVIHTNLAGGKTDRVVKDTIEHRAVVQPDGSIIDTVKLIRRHTGKNGENVFTGVQNNSYVRFYVPAGSTLIEAKGFEKPAESFFEEPLPEYKTDTDLISIESEHRQDQASQTDIYMENGKTVFGNWMMVKPGQIAEATISYRLPFKLSLQGENNFYYSLLAQKQLGTVNTELRSNLMLPANFMPLAKFPADLPSTESEVNFSAQLATDQFYGVVIVSK